jgi:GPN-loop GTPase
MPGQIELYTHIPIVPALVRHLSRNGQLQINLCAAYLLESTFIVDRAKFFAGTLSAMSAMIMMELPHVNILSKMDLVKGMVGRRELRKFLDPDADLMLEQSRLEGEEETTVSDPASKDALMSGGSFQALNQAVAKLIDDFSMVSFLQLDVHEEDSVGSVLSYIDDAIQFHEAQEPKEPNDELVEQPWEDQDHDME